MYQLMLVDDEESVIEGLSLSIPWRELQIENVYKATSGREALKLLEQHSIDIVITDIRMPGIDGLELVEKIRHRWKGTKCILLSGYAEFEYAKKALEHETDNYLLKPVSDEDLIRAVELVQQKLKLEWEEASSRQRTMLTIREQYPLLRMVLLKELLTRSEWNEENIASRLELLELPFALDDHYALVIVRLDKDYMEFDHRSFSLFQYAIGNMAEEIFQSHFPLWHCMDDHEYLVVLAQAPSGEEATSDMQLLLDRLCAHLQRSVKLYLKGAISLSVGRWKPHFPKGLKTEYEEAVNALLRRAGTESEMFITGESADIIRNETLSLQALYEPPLFVHLLEAGRWEEANAKLEQMIMELTERFGESEEHIRETYYTVAAAYSHIAHKHDRWLSDIAGAGEDEYRASHSFRSARQLREWALRTLERLRGDTIKEERDYRADIVKRIQQFVEQHLDQDVSLQAVADHVHLHPVYVSKVYKMETGELFTEYLYRLRMTKAAYWLTSGTYKVYEIAAMLGYQSTPYFIRIFKKYYGKTPQEYRES